MTLGSEVDVKKVFKVVGAAVEFMFDDDAFNVSSGTRGGSILVILGAAVQYSEEKGSIDFIYGADA
jgi:hypothetical protein